MSVSTSPDLALEYALEYDPSPFNEDNLGALYHDIHKLDEGELVFRNHFKNAQLLVKDLGSYAADIVWQRHAVTHESRRNALIKEKRIPASFSEVEQMRSELIELVRAYKFPPIVMDSNSPDCNVTPKLLTLVNVLKGIMDREKSNFRGVIFVHSRTTGKALADVLNKFSAYLPGVRARALVGVGAAVFDPHADHLTKPQATTQFKDGTINLLIMTSVGYDVEMSRYSIAIVFDAFDGQSAVDLQQSRVRKSAKILLILTEKGNQRGMRTLASHQASSRRGSVSSMSSESSSRRRPDRTTDSGDEDDDDRPYIEVPETSTRIYEEDAPQVLMRYVSIKEKAPVTLNVEYRAVDETQRFYECTIHFPPSAELDDVKSEHYPSKAAARRRAAYLGCEELNRRGLLADLVAHADRKLRTLTKVVKPSIFDDELGVALEKKLAKERGKRERGSKIYPRKKLDLWRDSLLVPRDTLYPAIIYLDTGDMTLPDAYRTLCILTRLPLPRVPPFELFFPELNKAPDQEVAATVMVKLLPCAPFHVPAERASDLHRYTIRLVRSSTSKQFFCLSDRMVYYFLPMKAGWTSLTSLLDGSLPIVIDDLVDWLDVETAAAQAAWSPLDRQHLEEEINDTVIQDREMEFTRKFQPLRVRYDLNPLSKPEDSSREQAYASILDFCRAKRRGFEGVDDEAQPLLEVDKVLGPLNRLSPLCRLPTTARKLPAKYLIPELCVKYCLSLSSFRTSMLLPSIVARLEELLLVRECNSALFEGRLDEGLLGQALTAPSVGVGYDYQRLELLGDSFLKYLASIYLFVTCPNDGEGAMHVQRQRIISNFSLRFHSDRIGLLPQYIQSRPHGPGQWWPPNFRLYNPDMSPVLDASEKFIQGPSAASAGSPSAVAPPAGDAVHPSPLIAVDHADRADRADHKTTSASAPSRAKYDVPSDPMAYTAKELAAAKDHSQQELGDKCIADVAEAMLGAAWLTGQRDTALYVSHILGLPMSRMTSWVYLKERAPEFFRDDVDIGPVVLAKVRGVESILGHKFKSPFLAATSLTHASRSTRELPCYERLEFIGDAILDFLAVRLIFTRWGQLHEGWLTLLKGAMVSNSALAAVGVELGLHKYIIHDSPHLVTTVSTYVEEVTNAKEEDLTAAELEGRAPGEYWVHLEPPKVLSDIVEAIIGAIYVSDSFDPAGYEGVFDRLFKPFFLSHISLNTLAQHPTKQLFEILQARSCRQFELVKSRAETELLTEVQCDFMFHGHVLGTAIASTTAIASRRASAMALETIQAEPAILDKLCQCRRLITERGTQVASQATIPDEDG
ncbi:ribonuclease III [Calocera viscosa TUFC12733]|uniref:Ribonuclease III n=1 Tax=Calocera viscosa (strain TUFC12733) TaxID=1330018 RepID=A0A167J6N3_CALVF|nr:ribonuclease III [Calocera viscosa TUFC12733]